MPTFIRAVEFLAVAFFAVSAYANFLNPNLPTLPGDFLILKPGVRLYIPFASAIVLAVILTLVVGNIRFIP